MLQDSIRAACEAGMYSVAVILENAMKIVPLIKSGDLKRSVQFYTEVLDFERKWPGHEDREMANGVIDLIRDGAELQISRHTGDGVFGSLNRVYLEDVDEALCDLPPARPKHDIASRLASSYRASQSNLGAT
jgi:hypothetical protein